MAPGIIQKTFNLFFPDIDETIIEGYPIDDEF
jgi:hypothetical protein